ncbi:pentatricopeptide repeat-containing protein At4g18975, chloroplastic [Arachis hypogaea]|uniref:pentatricopeptide repeat-containing protein At4g18975, chloroplastic n=1 Tax=Arachis hypogaea TaxID=3818 RepID=UPI003B20CABA
MPTHKKKIYCNVVSRYYKLRHIYIHTYTSLVIPSNLYCPSNKRSDAYCAFDSSLGHSNISRSNSLSEKEKQGKKQQKKRVAKKEHHLWKSRDSAQSGQKALNLIRIVSQLPNEKEAVYGALDKWTAWETEFPVIAAAKALKILRKRRQWLRVIQVAKWMLSKGQGATMGTYDTLLLAFDMDKRVDEAESLWNMIVHAHTRSVSKRLFSRMVTLYDHHHLPEKIIEIFADMEELQVKPDEDTVRRVANAFRKLGQEEKCKLVRKRYGLKWKYIHFNGERVKVRTEAWEEEDPFRS